MCRHQAMYYTRMMFLHCLHVATHANVVRIPERYTCPQNWTGQYYAYGWVMTERSHPGHKGRTTCECVLMLKA